MFSLAACRRNNQQAANLWMRRIAMHTFGMLFRNLSCLSCPGLSLCRRLFVVLSLMLGFVTAAHAGSVTGQGSWETTLQARDLDGNTSTIEAYYDTVLHITWLPDAA